MDNTQNVPVNVTPSVAKAPEPTFDNGPSIVGKKDKKTAWILAIVLLLIIAAGGVGFGVWAYMDGNTQRGQLNAQISSLTQQNSELQEKIDNASIEITDGGNYKNPVIASKDSEKNYTISFSSSKVLGGTNALGESNQILDINIANGKITQCTVSDATYHEGGGVSKANVKDCAINGLDGDIYKIVEFGAGNDNTGNVVGFLMTDGAVYYLPLYDSVQNENYDIRGKVVLPGKVIDILTMNVDNGVTGWASTVFVLDDGTIVEYDESMLN